MPPESTGVLLSVFCSLPIPRCLEHPRTDYSEFRDVFSQPLRRLKGKLGRWKATRNTKKRDGATGAEEVKKEKEKEGTAADATPTTASRDNNEAYDEIARLSEPVATLHAPPEAEQRETRAVQAAEAGDVATVEDDSAGRHTLTLAAEAEQKIREEERKELQRLRVEVQGLRSDAAQAKVVQRMEMRSVQQKLGEEKTKVRV